MKKISPKVGFPLWQNLFLLTKTYFRNAKIIARKYEDKDTLFYFLQFLYYLFTIWFIIPLVLIDLFLIIFSPGMHLFRPLSKAGWKYNLITSIGITLAVAMIAQYTFFIYSYQYQAFQLYLEGDHRTNIEVCIESVGIEATFSHPDRISRIIQSTVTKLDLADRVLHQDIYFKRGTYTFTTNPTTNVSYFPNFHLVGGIGALDFYIYSNIVEGSIPERPGEILAILPQDFYDNSKIRVGSTVRIMIPIDFERAPSYSNPNAHTDVEVTGIVILDDLEDFVISNQDGVEKTISLRNLLSISDGGAAYASWPFAAEILQEIPISNGLASIYANIFYNTAIIDSFNIESELDLIKKFAVELKDSFLGNYYVEVNAYLVNLIEDFRSEYNLYQIFMLAFLAPTVALTLILTVYAANLVRKKRDRQLTILSEKGTKKIEIGSYLALESVLYGTLSFLLGLGLGYPFARFLSKSSSFLTFTSHTLKFELNIISLTIAVTASIVTIFLIQFINIITLLKKRNIEDYGTIKKTLPKFYNYFVDVFVLIVGILLWGLYIMPELSNYQSITAKFIGIPATIITLFGFLLIMQRLLPALTKTLWKVMDKINKDIIVTAIKQTQRVIQSFSYSSLILCLTFSIVIMSMVVPVSYERFSIEGAYYDLGADITIRGFSFETEYQRSFVESIDGIVATTEVRLVNLLDVSGDFAITYSCLIINTSSYQDVVHFRDDFASKPLDTLISSIESDGSALLQKDQLQLLNKQKGEAINLQYRGYNETRRQLFGSPIFNANVSVEIRDSFTYWPMLVKSLPSSNVRSINYHIVVNENFLEQIQVNPTSIIDYLYIRVDPKADVQEIATTLKENFGDAVQSIEDYGIIKPGSVKTAILYSAINSTLIMAFIINTLIIALFATLKLIDKEREIATMKAIGISFKQLLTLFLAEYLVLLLFSIAIGFIGGIIAGNMLMGIFSLTRGLPPVIMVYPWLGILSVVILMLVVSLVGALIPSLKSAKKEIGSELRQSE